MRTCTTSLLSSPLYRYLTVRIPAAHVLCILPEGVFRVQALNDRSHHGPAGWQGNDLGVKPHLYRTVPYPALGTLPHRTILCFHNRP